MSPGKSQVLLTRAKADRRLLLEILSLAVQFAKQPKTRKGLFLTIDGIIFIQGSSSKKTISERWGKQICLRKLFKTPISERWGKQICLNEGL